MQKKVIKNASEISRGKKIRLKKSGRKKTHGEENFWKENVRENEKSVGVLAKTFGLRC